MNPNKMHAQIVGAHKLLRGRARATFGDYHDVLIEAGPGDLVYMDPPYEGTSTGVDRRYYQQLERKRLIRTLTELNERNVPYILSYDGRHGDKTYGEPMPASLGMSHIELVAGRSSQGTLSGRNITTIESLYISSNLASVSRDSEPLQLFQSNAV
jgi:DNA adenine methylase